MANEIRGTFSLSVYKAACMAETEGLALPDFKADMLGTTFIKATISVGTTATQIPLGQVSSPHWGFLINKDSTNFILIRSGPDGEDLCYLGPGEGSPIPFNPSSQPYAVADTAACLMQYVIFSL